MREYIGKKVLAALNGIRNRLVKVEKCSHQLKVTGNEMDAGNGKFGAAAPLEEAYGCCAFTLKSFPNQIYRVSTWNAQSARLINM